MQGRIEMSPPLEQQYAGLLRDSSIWPKQKLRGNEEAPGSFRNRAETWKEAQAGQNLEVLDPASLPEAPAEPTGLAIRRRIRHHAGAWVGGGICG